MTTVDQSHIEITVGGTTYRLVVDTWQEVDAIDFAPRAVAGSPAFSEMGLYLDVPQMRWGHGFGKWTFSEEASYSFTGSAVDTSHDFIQLFTNPSLLWYAAGYTLTKMIEHRGILFFSATGGTDGCFAQKPSTLDLQAVVSGAIKDMMTNGEYMFLSRSGRMYIADAGLVSSATNNTLTCTTREWTLDLFNGGTVVIFDGTGAPQTKTITDTTADTLTISGTWSPNPDDTSYFFVFDGAGLDGNPPNTFGQLACFGGYMWGAESNKPWVHFWAEMDGSDAEGGQDTDTLAIRVGPGDRGKINKLMAFQNQLWVFREDGAWVIGDDNVAYHTLNLEDQKHGGNFGAAAVWNGFLVFPVRNTLYKYRSGLQDITPPRFNDEQPYKTFGAFRGMATRGKFLWVIGKTNAPYGAEADETYKFGALMRTDGVGWHKVLDLPGAIEDPTGLRVWLDPTNDKMYFSAVDKTSTYCYLWWVPLQANSDLPYESFATTGDHNLYTSYYDFGMRRISKSWANVTLDGDFPTGTSVTVSYRGDAQTAWTSLGTITTPLTSVAFPASTEHKKVQLRLNLQTSVSTNTPVVKTVILKAMMRPKVLYSISTDVIVDEDLSGPDRTVLGLSASEIRSALKAARDSVSPITLRDIHGDSASAYLSSLRFQMVEYEATGAIAEVARCTFVYVNQAS